MDLNFIDSLKIVPIVIYREKSVCLIISDVLLIIYSRVMISGLNNESENKVRNTIEFIASTDLLIPLEKVGIQLFSSQLLTNTKPDWVL